MNQKTIKADAEPDKQTPVVGIGASAGGLEALTKLFNGLPPNTNMAFVVIQHLSPDHSAFLPTALADATSMRVAQVNRATPICPNHVYVIAPGTEIVIEDNTLHPIPRPSQGHPAHHPIDLFFSSLAEYRDCQAIGIVLSGTATDGTRGLQAIKEVGGLALVQDPQEAKFAGMPRSALDALEVDFVLPVLDLAKKLAQLSHTDGLARLKEPETDISEEDLLQPVFAALKEFTDADFSGYKTATVQRRIARRMAVHRIEHREAYIRMLCGSREEARLLQQELLIHVTSFFRDPPVFEMLRHEVFPDVLKNMRRDRPVRVWVAGCATGEEVYSYALCLLDCMEKFGETRDIQIFGTDPGTQAIRIARAGVYSALAMRYLPEQTLARYFSKTAAGYQINRAVRDKCVFVEHNALRDPPFCNMDIISCRNVLIYFSPTFKQKILTAFHFGLNDPGYLVLGSAESISGAERFFSPVDESTKVFRRCASRRTMAIDVPRSWTPPSDGAAPAARGAFDEQAVARAYLLNHYLPPSVLVDAEMTVVHTHGETAPFLRPRPGDARQSLIAMTHPGLLARMRQALAAAQKSEAPVCQRHVVAGEDDAIAACNLAVIPIVHPGHVSAADRFYLVVFEPPKDVDADAAPPVAADAAELAKENNRLKHQLAAIQDYVHQLASARESTSDATSALNAKLNAANEELQSMNEEMQTSKEELHSTNEELRVVNDELQGRNNSLNESNTDLANLLDAVDLPVLILDAEHHIRRYTPQACELVGIREVDIGRSLHDLQIHIQFQGLRQVIDQVIQDGTTQQFEVQDHGGCWYRLMIRPCRTPSQNVVGAMLTFTNIDKLKQEVVTAQWAGTYAKGIVEAVAVPLVMLNDAGVILSANAAFYKLIDFSEAHVEGRKLLEMGSATWDLKCLREPLQRLVTGQQAMHTLETQHMLGGSRLKHLVFSMQAVTLGGNQRAVLLSIEDISARRASEAERAALLKRVMGAKDEAERANRAKDHFLAILSHELRTPLSSIAMQAELLGLRASKDPELQKTSEAIERGVHLQVQLIDDLLDVSRIAAGKLHMSMRPTSLRAVLHATLETTRAAVCAKQITVRHVFEDGPDSVCADDTRLQQVFANLLTNAIKFSPAGAEVEVRFGSVGNDAQVQVIDSGKGIEAEFLPHLFHRFTQEESSKTRQYGGLGLGLAIVHFLVEQHGGRVAATSEGVGCGTTITVTLPLIALSGGLLAPPPPQAEAPVKAAGDVDKTSALRGMQILLVDDDDMVRLALHDMLTFLGAKTQAVSDAKQAMDALDGGHFDVLLCDIAMPQVSGYQLLRDVRRREPASQGLIPAIALTAFAGNRDQLQTRAAGFAHHLAKPVKRENLVQAILATAHSAT